VWANSATVSFISTTYNVKPLCDAFIRSRARIGEVWDYGPAPASARVNVCSLSGDPTTTAIVEDSAAGSTGQSSCAQLLSGDWRQSG
jgi:hypothetical protein